jgi:hypothetical protein
MKKIPEAGSQVIVAGPGNVPYRGPDISRGHIDDPVFEHGCLSHAKTHLFSEYRNADKGNSMKSMLIN